MLLIGIYDMRFLVNDGVEFISTAEVASCGRVVGKIFGCFFDIKDAILTVYLAVKDSVDDRSVHQTLGLA